MDGSKFEKLEKLLKNIIISLNIAWMLDLKDPPL